MYSSEILRELKTVIQHLYLSDSLPWVIGYSGGKDSTATLQIVWMALSELSESQRNKTVHIINTDTRVESPIISRWVGHSLQLMKEAIKNQNLPFEVHQLLPSYEDSFWVNLLGKGYPVPRRNLRWCTDRLKIKPVNSFIKQKLAEHGEVIMILGTRKAESTNRARMMAKLEQQRVRELLSPNPTLKNEYVFSPLEDWTNDDVWVFLMMNKNPWGVTNQELMNLYKGAAEDGECPIMQDKSTPSCGNSRFGCWVCTVVTQDKSMSAMIDNDREKSWMLPLLDFRNEFGNLEGDRERRSFKKKNGTLQGYAGKLNHGPYKKEIREKWLRELLEIQTHIQKTGPEEYRDIELISQEELKLIREIWVNEKHEFDDSLPTIYEEATGKPWTDPEWVSKSSFGQTEWKILQETCSDLERDEQLLPEMMAMLIDIENNSIKKNSRKGLLSEIENTIKQNMFKNEDDALEYYSSNEVRKKENGLKYNERFFSDISRNSESDEEEDLFL